MIELQNCKVTLDLRYDHDETPSRKNHIITIELPLPGGYARYEQPITEDQFNNMKIAAELTKKGKR